MVPSQNPDGQVPGDRSLVQDQGHAVPARVPRPVSQVRRPRRQPRLVHVHAEGNAHEHRAVQNKYKPIITHDMHQQGGAGARIFVPPFTEPFDPNMHPLLRMQQNTVGQAMAQRCCRKAKKAWRGKTSYDMWSPARQYMVYHGQPRILTEIANSNLADPVKSANGRPLGPQESTRALPGAVFERHLDARPAGRLRRHRGARRHVARREVRPQLADELLSRASRHGRTEHGRAVRVRGVRATQRDTFGDLRDARHPGVRRRRDPSARRRRSAPTASSIRPARA